MIKEIGKDPPYLVKLLSDNIINKYNSLGTVIITTTISLNNKISNIN